MDLIGATISHYQIVEELGRGGMGVVYKARDVELDRIVAMKFLSEAVSTDEKAVSRFLTEARAAASLDHPNICSIYEVGRSESGQPFIAMAYYQGEELSEKLAEGPVSHEETHDIIRQLAVGLAAAHRAGIVHRDIKPQNLFVTTDGLVKILDFGLAKVSTQATLTAEGTTLGTISYMSPEQASAGEVDKRTDIWSLGVILYEMLAGVRPFDAPYPQATIYSILNAEPPELPEGIPEELRSIANKCLNKKPEGRFASAEEIAALLGARTIEIETGVAPARQLDWKGVGWFAVLFAVVAALSYFVFLRTPTTTSPPLVLFLPFEDASLQEDQGNLAETFSLNLPNELRKIAQVGILDRLTSLYYQKNPTPIRQIREDDGIDYLVLGRLSRNDNEVAVVVEMSDARTGTLVWEKSYREDYGNLYNLGGTVVSDIAVELGAELISRTASYQPRSEAYEEYLAGLNELDRIENETLFRAIEHFERAIALDSLWALPYTGVARASMMLYDRQSLNAEQVSHGVRRATQGMQLDSLLAEAWLGQTFVEFVDGDYAEELRSVLRAVELNSNLPAARNYLSTMYGLFLDREMELEELMAANRLAPKNMWQLIQLAWIQARRDEWDRAQETLEDVYSIDSTHFAAKYSQVMMRLHTGGDVDGALELLESVTYFGDETPLRQLQIWYKLMVYMVIDREELFHDLMTHSPDSIVTPGQRILFAVGTNDYERAFSIADSIDFRAQFFEYRYVQTSAPDSFIEDPRWLAIQERLGVGPTALAWALDD